MPGHFAEEAGIPVPVRISGVITQMVSERYKIAIGQDASGEEGDS
jgi:hypothetical protein